MPKLDLAILPDDARAWVFASERELTREERERLLAAVDGHLDQWAAHGAPLYSGREIREGRFLVVAVDERAAGASGCSIDGLYRQLRRVEEELRVRLTVGGQVFLRDTSGRVTSLSRDEFADRAARGELTAATPVFDTALTSLGAIRNGFEVEAGRSWHATLLPDPVAPS